MARPTSSLLPGSPSGSVPTTPGSRGARTVDPRDRAQLAESPVSWGRVGALFRPFRGRVATVMVLIVA